MALRPPAIPVSRATPVTQANRANRATRVCRATRACQAVSQESQRPVQVADRTKAMLPATALELAQVPAEVVRVNPTPLNPQALNPLLPVLLANPAANHTAALTRVRDRRRALLGAVAVERLPGHQQHRAASRLEARLVVLHGAVRGRARGHPVSPATKAGLRNLPRVPLCRRVREKPTARVPAVGLIPPAVATVNLPIVRAFRAHARRVRRAAVRVNPPRARDHQVIAQPALLPVPSPCRLRQAPCKAVTRPVEAAKVGPVSLVHLERRLPAAGGRPRQPAPSRAAEPPVKAVAAADRRRGHPVPVVRLSRARAAAQPVQLAPRAAQLKVHDPRAVTVLHPPPAARVPNLPAQLRPNHQAVVPAVLRAGPRSDHPVVLRADLLNDHPAVPPVAAAAVESHRLPPTGVPHPAVSQVVSHQAGPPSAVRRVPRPQLPPLPLDPTTPIRVVLRISSSCVARTKGLKSNRTIVVAAIRVTTAAAARFATTTGKCMWPCRCSIRAGLATAGGTHLATATG